MGDWPQLMEGQRIADAGTVTASSIGTGITAAGSANVKGSWTQLIASTVFDSSGMVVIVAVQQSAISELIDIGIGAGGSEQVLVPNLYFYGSSTAAVTSETVPIPVAVPAGARLSARIATSTAGLAASLIVYLIA